MRGLAEQLGTEKLSRADIGLDVTGYLERDDKTKIQTWEKLPAGHHFFPDCIRESHARKIEWLISTVKDDAWFVTLTFKDFVTVGLANRLMLTWLNRLEASYQKYKGSGWLNWVCATEWQKRQVIHFHLIVFGAGLRLLSRMRWENRWMATYKVCGFARIYDARKSSAPYLAKYTSKSLNGDLQWCRTWQGLSAPESLSCCKAGLPGHPPTAR